MVENDNMIENQVEDSVVTETVNSPEPVKPSKGGQIKAAIKEWFRKFVVGLKHKTHKIPFIFLVVTSFIYLCFLGTLSPFIEKNSGISSLGIFMFVNTLASILVLLLFLYSFPNRKKTNLIFLSITFAVLALMVVMDIVFYINIVNYAADKGFDLGLDLDGAYETLDCVMAHIVLLAICIVVLATMPLYKKLICKINTTKEVKSSTMNEVLDTSEEDG